MRDKIISALTFLIWVLGAILLSGGFFAGIAVMSDPSGGFFKGIFVMLIAVIYAILTLGFYFIASGIYENTRRTAAAVDKLANR